MSESTTGAARRRLLPSPTLSLRSGTGVEHRDGAPILRPAGYVVADGDRPLLAVGNGPHAMRLDPARGEIIVHRLRAPRAQRDIVFARAALVGMAFDREMILRVGPQPLRLLFQGGD